MTRLACDLYTSGEYFADPARHSEDGDFKARECVKLLGANRGLEIKSLADVGCGSGAPTIAMVRLMQQAGHQLTRASGYDISPHIEGITHPFIRFVHDDFTETDEFFDMVTLFDVVEHVPDPITFIKQVARHASLICLNIPLDASLNLGLRNLWRRNLRDPGHLIVLDPSGALNLLAFAGLRVIDYRYTPSFRACSGHKTRLGKVAYLFRWFLYSLSPWLVAKTIGGASLMVLAQTPPKAR
ncbi:MAG TPA: methyltransferase domain-containing protein [Candidatus Acidoferrales bacterium]|nr:methyltransferase domain-containing protein [Candidatus Acidoferrales bacterium]